MNFAHELLQQEANIWRELAARQNMRMPLFKDWLLQQGEECGPAIKRPKGVRMGTIKQCYENSLQAITYRTVDRDEWFYTEGVVARPDLPILIDHAWLTNRKGEVLDLTLRDQKDASYYGVPFKPDAAVGATMRHGYYGLFSNGWRYNQDIVGKTIGRTRRAWRKK
jgi:hypothetical protein